MDKERNDFLEHIRKKGFKEKTLKFYRYTLDEFLTFIGESRPEIKEAADITSDDALLYEKYLVAKTDSRGKVLSRNMRGRYLTTLKTFFQYLEKRGKIYGNPAANISMPKLKKPVVKDILTVEEMDDLLEKISGDTLKGLRDRAILELLYSTGVKSDELCGLHIEDVDFAGAMLNVRRGNCVSKRTVPFGESALHWLRRYVKKARPLLCGGDKGVLFFSVYGRKLKPDNLRTIILDCMKKAKLDRRLTSLTFRHSCAAHMLRGGADIRYVQKQLGHTNICSTQKYLKIEISDLKDIHERCHPREQEDW